jgi:hypothetical protein
MTPLMKNMTVTAGTLLILMLATELVARFILEPVSRENLTTVPSELITSPTYSGVPYVLHQFRSVTQSFGSDPRGYFDEGATLTYRTNNLGFRGPSVHPKKQPDTIRIVGLGDSFTFGTGVRYEDTFLYQLERKYDDEPAPLPVQVMNLGVPAYDTSNEVATLLSQAAKLTPDVVVICFFLNDNGDIPDFMNIVNPKGRAWYRSSRFLDVMLWRVERRRQGDELVKAFFASFQPDSRGWLLTKDSMAAAKYYSEQYGFDLVVMIFPVLWQLSGDYPFAEIHDTVCEFVDGLGVPCLDLQPEFKGYDGPELWVHPNNQHPNEVAHKIAADALYGFLADRKVLERHADRSAE